MQSHNEAANLVWEYSTKKILAKLGYTFDGSNLTQFEVEAMTLIESEFNKIESEEIKRARKR